ncbi:thiol:disulfide interchange protein TlpA [Stappia indica]|uniref:Thiol-disulfide isomerase or thioredoxin n=1 Tax=Stappia indica TaxID=538381 RepID=A0A285RY89_9HYPH|nr:TlpA family protein disulfide reductase [Stappia indica]SOB99427.1 Thiol-disulfide isomerase or thioredoxin [Stappia indica]
MTNGTRPPRRTLLVGIAAVALMAGLAGIYVIGGADGNQQQAGSCSAAASLASQIAPLARGEVAAFLPAKAPSQLSELAFSNDAGAPLTLGDFRDKVVLVNLWATWCAPCRKEMPALDQLQAELGSDDFEVVAVSVDQTGEEKPRAFLKEIGVSNLAFYADPTMKIFQDVRARGRAPGLPTTLLVDGKGCEIGALMGPAEWASEDAKALVRAAIEAQRKTAAAGAGS